MPHTPFHSALARAKDAYRLMLTHGVFAAGYSFDDQSQLFSWLDAPRTNLRIYLNSNGSYARKEAL